MRRAAASLLALLASLVLLVPAPAAAADDVLRGDGVLVDPAAPPPPVPQAAGWLVADVDSGEVLAASGARTPLAPASTLKLLTALALSPGHEDGEVHTASAAAAGVDGSKVGVVEGSRYRYGDLLHALLMASGNDAAVAMAEIAGGTDAAAARMNDVAADLGASDTVAVNTSGLDADGQTSSARDLALLAGPVLDDERLARVLLTERYAFPGAGEGFGPGRPTFEIGNHNRLVGSYPGALGLKNGYTEAARGALVAAAERDGRRLVAVVVRAEGSEADQCTALLDWAFALPPGTEPVTTLQASVRSASEAEGKEPRRDPAVARDAQEVAEDVAQEVAEDVAGAAVPSGAGPPAWLVVPLALLALLAAAVVYLRLTRDARIARRRARRQTLRTGR